MPPKKIKIQSKIDKPQDNKNIIKVEKLSSKEEKSSIEEDKKIMIVKKTILQLKHLCL